MGIYDKLKWILGICMIFVLIITTNLIDKNNFVRVRDSVITIYEDRLKADELIFKMLEIVHSVELELIKSDSLETKHIGLTKLQTLISKFEQTKLTSEEAKIFSDLKENTTSLQDIEVSLAVKNLAEKNNLHGLINEIKINLRDLSKIQLDEGSRQFSIINRAVETVELFTQIEIYILVFLGVLVQIIVMYNPKKK